MKKFSNIVVLLALTAVFAITALAQDNQPNQKKIDDFNKIVKLSQSKKPEDQEKAYKTSQDFVAKYGKDNDTMVTKIKEFVAKYPVNNFNARLSENKTAEAFTVGKQILASEPENTYVVMNLAYSGFNAFTEKNDKTFAADSLNYAKQAISLMEAGKMPSSFVPFKDQAEALALMHYTIGVLTMDTDAKEAGKSFYKAVQYDSQIKNKSYAYYAIAMGYEKIHENLANEFKQKRDAKAPEAELFALQDKIEKTIDLMLDAYARALKVAETDKDPGKDAWKTRFVEVYKYRKQSDAGLEEYIAASLSKPFPDPGNSSN